MVLRPFPRRDVVARDPAVPSLPARPQSGSDIRGRKLGPDRFRRHSGYSTTEDQPARHQCLVVAPSSARESRQEISVRDKQPSVIGALAATAALAVGGCSTAGRPAPTNTAALMPAPTELASKKASTPVPRSDQLSELRRLVEQVDGELGPSGVAYAYILFARQVRQLNALAAREPEPRQVAARRRRSARERRPTESRPRRGKLPGRRTPAPAGDDPGLAYQLGQGKPIAALR